MIAASNACWPRDACGSGDAEAHRAALHMVTVEDGVFGALADVGAIVAALERLDQVAAQAPSRRLTFPAGKPRPRPICTDRSGPNVTLGDWSI